MLKSVAIGLGLVASGALVAAACSSSGSDDDDGSVNRPGRPPGPSANAPAASGPGIVFAMSKVFLGDATRDLVQTSDAWQDFGFDIDEATWAEGDEAHCTPQEFWPADMVHPDGPNGEDNSFGRNILPIIGSLAPTPSENITRSISEGQVTFMLVLPNLGPEADQSEVQANLLTGARRLFNGQGPGTVFDSDGGIALDDAGLPIVCPNCEPPNFDGNDDWPVAHESTVGGDVNNPGTVFQGSYVTGGTFVARASGIVTLRIPMPGVTLELNVRGAVITGEVVDFDTNPRIINGNLGGFMATEDVIETFKAAASAQLPPVCGPVSLLLKPVRQASDTLLEGPQDPEKECDAISIGLGFEALPVKVGDVADPAPPGPPPCP